MHRLKRGRVRVFVLVLRAASQGDTEQEVDSYLRRRFEGRIADIEPVAKEDLGLVRRARVCEVAVFVPAKPLAC